MRNVGGRGREHSGSVSLAARVYYSTPRSRARTQYKPQSRSRVLRIRAARTWVNGSCALPRSALRATSAPAEPKGTRSAGPIGARGSEPRQTASLQATEGRSRRSPRRWFGRLVQEEQRLKKQQDRSIQIQRLLLLESFVD